MSGCQAKIRPFVPVNMTEVSCRQEEGSHEHEGVLRDYAYPGSETVIRWSELDRRTFRGTWTPCSKAENCILPHGHPRGCAT